MEKMGEVILREEKVIIPTYEISYQNGYAGAAAQELYLQLCKF